MSKTKPAGERRASVAILTDKRDCAEDSHSRPALQLPGLSGDLSRSNSLTDLAARIRSEHEAVSTALKESVRHAITAGELLIEAKSQVQHGQWLSWLRDHCAMSERTAQLYMRTAKNRKQIESKSATVLRI